MLFCSFLSEGKSDDDGNDAMEEITRQLEKHKVNCFNWWYILRWTQFSHNLLVSVAAVHMNPKVFLIFYQFQVTTIDQFISIIRRDKLMHVMCSLQVL